MAYATSTTCDPGAEAFCVTCPGPEELTSLLQGFGFHLTFQMEAIMYPAYTRLPPLPAQYHYRDEYVMYHQKSTPFDPSREIASRAGSAV
jgi:hypothetical protein